MKKKLSVVIITKNEEKKIARCLESVHWADEIVLVDDFSSDGTLRIASRWTDKIIQRKLCGEFDRQRNSGIENCTGDWILQLDADETVTEELRKEIENLLAKDSDDYAGYSFMRKTFFLGHFMRYGGWYHKTVKLFQRGKAHYEGHIHELLAVDGKVGDWDVDIEHHPFDNITEFITRQNFYTSLEAQRLSDEKRFCSSTEIKRNITIKPLKIFWKSYVRKRGYKEGFYGLIFAALDAFVYSLRWAKYWEIVKDEGRGTTASFARWDEGRETRNHLSSE